MNTAVTTYLERNREKLKDYASSLIFFSWADMALEQGAEADEILFQVMTYNIKGGK